MEQIAIITDSVACLPSEITGKYNITIVPAGNIYFEGKTYRDWIDLSYSEAYHILEKSQEEFFTGPTSPLEFLQLYKHLAQDHKYILYISLSSKLSTLYNVARLSREMALAEIPGIRIEIMDSTTATAAEGFIAIMAARAAMAGKNFEEVIKIAGDVKEKVGLFYVLYTVKYVYRTGRVPRQLADLGSKLNVKPLVTIKNGSAQVRGFVRNTRKGIDSMLELARQRINNNKVHMAVLHAEAWKDAEVLKQRVSSEFDCVELWVGEFSPLMVYATGKGVLGIAFYVES
jgi:DegV family protein with EDD domain